MKVKINDFGIMLDGEGNTIVGGIELHGYELMEIKNFIIMPDFSKLCFTGVPKLKVETFQMKGINPCKKCGGTGRICVESKNYLIPINEDSDISFSSWVNIICPDCLKVMKN